MNTSIDKVSSPQTRRFERGNKQLLLALASVSMLGFAGSALGANFSITPPSSILTTDKQAFFNVSITGGATTVEVIVSCYSFTALGGAVPELATAGIITTAGGITFGDTTAYYKIPASTNITASFPIPLTLSGQVQGGVIACQVSSGAPTDVLGTTASLSIGAGAAAARLYAFDTTTTSQVSYDSTNQIYPAVPPETSPRCVNIGLVAPNATNNPIKTLTVGSTTTAVSADYVASLIFFPSPDTAFGLSSTTGSSITSSLNNL